MVNYTSLQTQIEYTTGSSFPYIEVSDDSLVTTTVVTQLIGQLGLLQRPNA